MATIVGTTFQVEHIIPMYGTHAEFTTVNPVLAEGEIVVVTDLGKTKVGNGTSTYSQLSFSGHNTAATASADGYMTQAQASKLAGIEDNAEVNVLEAVKDGETALTIGNDKSVSLPQYSLEALATPTAGYQATYRLTKNGNQVGDVINIAKNYLVKSAALATVATADTPYTGAVVGEKYIDFTVNTAVNSAETHLYLPVNDLVDTYTASNGIEVSAGNVISLKIDSANANGLMVSSSGVALTLATTSTAGAMSSTDKTNLTNIMAVTTIAARSVSAAA